MIPLFTVLCAIWGFWFCVVTIEAGWTLPALRRARAQRIFRSFLIALGLSLIMTAIAQWPEESGESSARDLPSLYILAPEAKPCQGATS